jgi:cytochrome P450
MGELSWMTGSGRSPRAPLDITSPEFKANPYPFYARLRAETPVHHIAIPSMRGAAWLIARYDDAALVLKDERFVKATANAKTPEQMARQPWMVKLFNSKLFKAMNRSMIAVDPPDHTRLRALVTKAFTPRLVEQMRDRIQRLADHLLDAVQKRGRMELMRDYALPMPTTIIAEMLGVPAEDRCHFNRWTKAMGSAVSLPGLLKAIPSVWMLMRYIRKVIKKRRAKPLDDLVSALAQAEEAGDTLSEDELLAMIFLLLLAGYETTANLIGNGALALLEHPDEMNKLRNDPTLIKPAVEELLRYGSPVELATARYAREDVAIAGVTIPRGDGVFAVIASANRDQRQFAKPDSLDITREPNKHLAFGLGTRFCLGAALARMEGQIAISTLLRRLPDLRLAVPVSAVRWRRGLMLRGLEAMPVAFGTARARALSDDGILLLEFVGRVATSNDGIDRVAASESFASGVRDSGRRGDSTRRRPTVMRGRAARSAAACTSARRPHPSTRGR